MAVRSSHGVISSARCGKILIWKNKPIFTTAMGFGTMILYALVAQ